MGIIAGLIKSLTPFITITLQLTISFVVLIWFTLSIIYAIITIINFLLGQPLVGWILTGNINASSDWNTIVNTNAFSLASPIMIFLYVTLIFSTIMFVVYFIFSLTSVSSTSMALSGKIASIILILTAVVWIPFIYFLLVLGTSGLLYGMSQLFDIFALPGTQGILDSSNIESFLSSGRHNLLSLKSFLLNNDLKIIDLESVEVTKLISQLSSNDQTSVYLFLESWNSFISKNPVESIDLILDKLFSGNLESELDINAINALTSLQANFNQLTSYYGTFQTSISGSLINDWNSLFGWTSVTTPFFENIKNSFTVNFMSDGKESILPMATLSNYLITESGGIAGNDFAQNLVNILYRLALNDPNVIFVAGWTNNILTDGTSILTSIPYQIMTPFLNVSIYLHYNVRLLAIGTIANSLILPGIVGFAFILIKRTTYILLWPFFMMFKLSRGAEDEGELMKASGKEIFFKFLQIIFLSFFWNLIISLGLEIYSSFTNSSFFQEQVWIKDIASILLLAGILVSSGLLIKEFVQQIEAEKNPFEAGANQISRASSKGSNNASKIYSNSKNRSNSINRSVSRGLAGATTGKKKSAEGLASQIKG